MQSTKQTKLADVHLIKKRRREKIAVVICKSNLTIRVRFLRGQPTHLEDI